MKLTRCLGVQRVDMKAHISAMEKEVTKLADIVIKERYAILGLRTPRLSISLLPSHS